MGNIVNDVVEDVVDYDEEKSKKSKTLIKIIIGISIILIGSAFTIGQFRSALVSRINNIQTTINTQTTSIGNLENEINTGFEIVDKRINKVYSDGLKAFDKNQQFNKKQLILVLDYGQENKDLVKRMLELNSIKNRNEVENQVEKSKNEPVKNESEGRIVTFPVKTKMPDFIEIDSSINNDGKKTFYLTGISLEYVNNFDNTKYEIDDLKVNPKNNDVYDITYHNK